MPVVSTDAALNFNKWHKFVFTVNKTFVFLPQKCYITYCSFKFHTLLLWAWHKFKHKHIFLSDVMQQKKYCFLSSFCSLASARMRHLLCSLPHKQPIVKNAFIAVSKSNKHSLNINSIKKSTIFLISSKLWTTLEPSS